MAAAVITAVGNGLEAHAGDLAVLRQYADELAANGVEYEEQDRRAEPISTLLITVTAAALSTAASELVKLIIKRLAERDQKPPAAATIQVHINARQYILPKDQAVIITEIDALTRR